MATIHHLRLSRGSTSHSIPDGLFWGTLFPANLVAITEKMCAVPFVATNQVYLEVFIIVQNFVVIAAVVLILLKFKYFVHIWLEDAY